MKHNKLKKGIIPFIKKEIIAFNFLKCIIL